MRSSTRTCESLTLPSSSLLSECLRAERRCLCSISWSSGVELSVISSSESRDEGTAAVAVVSMTLITGVGVVGEGGSGIIWGSKSDCALDLWDGERCSCLSWIVPSSCLI